MNLPYVIDNRIHRLADVLNDLLHSDPVHALDVATAYFNAGGFDLLHDGLERLASFRLLLGSEPGSAQDLGLRLRRDLEAAPYNAETLHRIETLIRFLRREHVAVRLYRRGFLHAKSYLFFADEAPGDRFIPVAGIVGSSNFTRAGLITNQELNLTHKAIVDPDEAEDHEAQAAVEPLLGRSSEGRSSRRVTAACSSTSPRRRSRARAGATSGATSIWRAAPSSTTASRLPT